MNQPSTRMRLIGIAAVIAVALGTGIVAAEGPDDPLARGFRTPPASAKPRVWWHWMSGNITKAGIKADLEWMKRTGIAGFQNFDAGLETPQIVAKRLVYMTPGWKDAFKYTATLADELGLEMAIAGSPGWSESGGPWVTPAQAMKKYVWSETRLEGGRPFSGVLPKPPSTTGPYQNLGGRHEGFGEGSKAAPPEFYADSAVVAFRVPENDRTPAELGAKVTSSGGAFDLAALTRRRPRRGRSSAGRARRREVLDPIRLRPSPGRPRPHADDRERRTHAAATTLRNWRRATTAGTSGPS